MEKEKIKKFGVSLAFLFSVSLALASSASAAGLFFNPSRGNFYKNENFSVNVFVNAEQAINAVQGTVSFPTEYLEAVSVKSNGNSIIDLWVRKPSFSNAGDFGNVNFEGVVLNPGFTGSDGRILEVVFRVKKEGLAEINFSESAVLANNGLGTNVLTSNGKAAFSLLPPRFAPETPASENLQMVEDRITNVEQQIKTVREDTGVLSFWFVLPKVLRWLILIFVGLTALLLSIVILGFIVIVLTWLWSYIWRRRKKIEHKVEAMPHKADVLLKKVFKFLKLSEKEVKGDVKYGFRLFKRDFIEAETNRSFKRTLKDYWQSIVKIYKRFITKNVE